jgi:multiple sugar transport system permease protein
MPGSTKHKRVRFATVATYIALIILGTAFTLPFAWMICTSLKPASRIQKFPPDIIPMKPVSVKLGGKLYEVYRDKDGEQLALIERLKGGRAAVQPLSDTRAAGREVNADELTPAIRPGFEWSNYSRGLVFIPFAAQLRNTLIVSICCVLGTILSCSLVAYGLSKIDWKGRNTLFVVVLATMMLPAQVTMIPVFTIFVKLHWVNTFLPLIVPSFLATPFFIFLLRQFFLGIPRELSEAAKLDGCSEFGIYRRVIMPLSRPALATVGLFTFIGAWNEFLGPLIYLLDETKYTLSLGLAMFTGQYGNEYGMLMAVSTVVTIPIIVLFFFTQRTFIQGMTMSGIKG